MAMERKFDPREIAKLKDPERQKRENPDLIWEKLELKNPSCFVDVGAGAGYLAVPFAEKMPKGTVYACDIEPKMLESLREEIAASGATNIVPVLAEEARIPLEDGIADAVLMQNVHHELHSGVETLRECRRLLKEGGSVAVIDWRKETMKFGPPMEIRVSVKKIGSDMREAGFTRITSLEVLPCHSFLIARKP